MKKLVILLLSYCSFFVSAAQAQTIKTININYSEKDFQLIPKNEGIHICSSTEFLTFSSDTLQPALPHILKYVLLDYDNEYDGLTVSTKDTLLKSDVTLYTNQLPRLVGTPRKTEKEFTDYRGVKFYPENNVIYTGTYYLEDKKYASFLLSPFRYDAEKRLLYLNTSITLNVKLKKSQKGVLTKEAPYKESNQNDRKLSYLIITNDSLKPTFQELADWKTSKGVNAKVLTTEEIYGDYTGSTSPIKIKKAIRECWVNNRLNLNPFRSKLEYVLLGGDVNIVPSQMCLIKCNIDPSNSKHTPSDWFYGTLIDENVSWDKNSNGEAGEVEDNIDLGASVIVSRLPASNIQEAQNMVERIIHYEKTPSTENWKDNILMCGALLDTIQTISGASDAEIEGNITYLGSIAPYWDGERFRLYDTVSDLEGEPPYKFLIDNFQEEMEKGYSFINVDTHGNEFQLRMGWDPNAPSPSLHHSYYDVGCAESLNNSGNSVFITCACSTNAFDEDKCLSEAFMRNPNSGILSYIGPSREGWLVEDSMYTHQFNRQLYRNFFESWQQQIARGFMKAKNNLVGYCNNYNEPWRWIFLSENILGDPEMPIYLSKPKCMNGKLEFTYQSADDDVYIRDTVGHCEICVMSRDDNGDSLYVTHSDTFGFQDVTSELSFCITSADYIPYLGVYAPTVHLQNEMIGWDYHVISKNALIGRNVTNRRTEGEFVIEKGKTTIYAPRGTTINDSFEVKIGAELEILATNP